MGLRLALPSLVTTFVCLLGAALSACAECEKDFDCPGTKVCKVEEGQCEDFVCSEDRDCPPAKSCRGNRCRTTEADPPDEDADAFILSAPVSGPPAQDAAIFSPPD